MTLIGLSRFEVQYEVAQKVVILNLLDPYIRPSKQYI